MNVSESFHEPLNSLGLFPWRDCSFSSGMLGSLGSSMLVAYTAAAGGPSVGTYPPMRVVCSILVMMTGLMGSVFRGFVPCNVVVWCSPAEMMSTSSCAAGSWYSSLIGFTNRDVEGTGVLSVSVVFLLSGCRGSVVAQ